jgi:dCMP deaminase
VNSKEKKNKTILISYVPVLHQGYFDFFIKNIKKKSVKELWLIGTELAYELRPLQKDIRALSPEIMKELIESMRLFEKIKIIDPRNIKDLKKTKTNLIFSNEEISHHLVDKYFTKNKINFDSTFLMWDEKSSLKKTDLKGIKAKKITKGMQAIIEKSLLEKTRSDDWWRHVGAVAFRDKKILLSKHNKHIPTEYQTAYEGDPRANFHKGEHLKVSTAIHAEAILIAEAAKQGISLEGAELLVTTFPCPVCAKQIAYSGIKKVYFIDGYSVLDGKRILEDKEIKTEKIKI